MTETAALHMPDRRRRREMGVTFGDVRRVTRQLHDAGEIDGDTPTDAVAAMVLDRLIGENPKAFDDPGIDWDALLDFIERLIPLIMRIIELFSAV